nr:uncharacterized protein LOC129464062 isoform X3 [Symphalangus syndactylus]XP_055100953.1 uncharacterized protein LOC129464062 isoform X3 [Symphalangus syndactylus]XP_055100963.1 uncharacterized protein LOC129464062 isoform X3 [Symphalangus syndactylus]
MRSCPPGGSITQASGQHSAGEELHSEEAAHAAMRDPGRRCCCCPRCDSFLLREAQLPPAARWAQAGLLGLQRRQPSAGHGHCIYTTPFSAATPRVLDGKPRTAALPSGRPGPTTAAPPATFSIRAASCWLWHCRQHTSEGWGCGPRSVIRGRATKETAAGRRLTATRAPLLRRATLEGFVVYLAPEAQAHRISGARDPPALLTALRFCLPSGKPFGGDSESLNLEPAEGEMAASGGWTAWPQSVRDPGPPSSRDSGSSRHSPSGIKNGSLVATATSRLPATASVWICADHS